MDSLSSSAVRQLRLLSQRLVGASGKRTPREVVAWLGAAQAQDYAGAKWGIGMRTVDLTDALVEQAFNDGEILRTHLLRPTWHFVAREDIRWLLALTAARVHAANASIYRASGLDAATFRRSDRVLARALADGRPLTRDDLRARLEWANIDPGDGVRTACLVMHAELEQIICSGPRVGSQFTYMLMDARAPVGPALSRADALGRLALRFFQSRGPATIGDFARWSGVTMADARQGLDAGRSALRGVTYDSREHWIDPEALEAWVDMRLKPSVHVMSVFDEYMSGYRDRTAMVDVRMESRLRAMRNGVASLVVVDGTILGSWTRRLDARSVTLAVSMSDVLSAAQQRRLRNVVAAYGRFLGRAAILA